MLNFLQVYSTVNLQLIFVENATTTQMPIATVIYDLSLLTIPVSNCHLFSDINISHGSVATRLRCGGILSYHFTANLSLSLTMKEF